jgi:hypothetical protein
MRERLNVPIAFDRSLGGYRIDASSGRYALPGLWFVMINDSVDDGIAGTL